jgi:3-deoxy-D-manno-octulosonic-acid transferase
VTAFALYGALGRLVTPALAVHLRRRARAGKEDAGRLAERFGIDPRPRPPGPLAWVHAASLGESVSVLPVIERLVATAPPIGVVLTTGTRSSAALMAERLPAGALHAYAPVDTAPALRRFVAHWRPDATVLVEQELWPMLLALSPAPRLLVNARLSARSARRWARLAPVARGLLRRFERILAQSEADAARLRRLGAVTVETPGNLKDAAPPLPVDPAELEHWRRALDGRRIWIAASTHAGEEELVAHADAALRDSFPELLTVLVPRHPERADAIVATLARPDLRRLADAGPPGPETRILLVDRFGALGLFYRLAEVAFVGGSLIPHGGQNPLEPARLGRPVLFGPHMTNFAEAAAALTAAGAGREVAADGLARTVGAWLTDDAARRRAGAAGAEAVAHRGEAALAETTAAIRNAVTAG